MLYKAIFGLIVLAQLSSVAIANGFTHLAQDFDLSQYPTDGCNKDSDQKKNQDTEDTTDGSCTGQKANQRTCADPYNYSRVWMDLGDNIRLRTVVVLERSIPSETHREASDSKAVRGCNSDEGAGTNGSNFNSTSSNCFDCGSQSGLAANQAITCDMTVQYLYVFLTEYDEVLQLNEIAAFGEISIGHTGDPSGATATVTVMPEPVKGHIGTNLWKDMMILYDQDSDAEPYMAMAEAGPTAADTYVTIEFIKSDNSVKKVHISKVLIFGNLQNASEKPIDPDYAIYAYTAVSSSNASPAYVQCGADITSTCSERDCDQYATALKVEKTVDHKHLYLGGIVVFECNITDYSSTEVDDDLYRQGDDELTITMDYNLEAECTTAEYDEEIVWTYTVLKDNVEVSSYPELTFDDNSVDIEIDEEYTDDPLYDEFTYTITITGTLTNSYGENVVEETFDVEIKDWCWERGADGELNTIDDITHDIYQPTTTHELFTGPYGWIDADYPQCYTLETSDDCSSLGTVTVDFENGDVIIDRVTDATNTGTCTVTIELKTLDSDQTKGTVMDTITFDITYEYNCDITVAYNTYPIEYTLSSGNQTTDLQYSIENSYCPNPTGHTLTCPGVVTAALCNQIWVNTITGIISIDSAIGDGGYLETDQTINWSVVWVTGDPNEITVTGSYEYLDPCIESATAPDVSTAITVVAIGTADQDYDVYDWTWATSPAACNVAPTYTLQRLDYDPSVGGNPLNDVLVYDPATNVLTFNGQYPAGEFGYIINLVYNFTANFEGWTNSIVQTVNLKVDITKPGPEGPVFTPDENPALPPFTSNIAYTYTFPSVSNTSGSQTTTWAVTGSPITDGWMIWDLSTKTLTVAAAGHSVATVSQTLIQVVLSDSLGYSNTYTSPLTLNPAAANGGGANGANGGNRGPPLASSFEGVVIQEEPQLEAEPEPVVIEPEIVPVEEDVADPVQVSDTSVDNEGILEMDFSKDIIVPEETARRLAEDGHFDLSDYSKIEVVGGSYDSAEDYALAIKPVLSHFDSKKIQIDLKFRRPLDVSTGSEPDYAIFTLTDNSIFTDAQSGRPIDYFEKKMYLPKLVDTNNPEDVLYMKELEQNGQTAGAYFGMIITLTFVVSLALATSLKGLWMFIHFAQVVAYLKYYSPNLPANMATIFSLLESTINLSFLGVDGIFEGWDAFANEKFGLAEEAAGVKALGKDGASISKNVGLYLFAYMILVLSIAVFMILKQITERSRFLKPTLSKFVSFLQEKLFFNAFLRTMILGCLSFDHLICVLFLLQMRASDDNKSGALVTFCVIFMIVMATIPPVVGFLLKKYRNKLENKTIKQRFGALYSGVRTTHTCTIVYTAVFMLRRLVLVLVAVYGQNLKHWLAMAFVVQQLFYLVYLTAVRPQYQPIENFVEILNEVTTLVFGYFMIFTTDFVPEVTTQYHYGWVVSQIIMTVMILNLVYMIGSVSYEGFYQKRHQLKLNELNKRREIKIDQIKKSSDEVKRNRMTDNELSALMKLKFQKRGQNSPVTVDGVKDYTQSVTYKSLGLFDQRRNQVVNQSPTKKSLKEKDDLSLEIGDSNSVMRSSYIDQEGINEFSPQNLTVVYEEDDHEQLENSFRSGTDMDNMSLMFGRDDIAQSKDDISEKELDGEDFNTYPYAQQNKVNEVTNRDSTIPLNTEE